MANSLTGIDFKNKLGQYEGGIGATAALLAGIGSSSAPMDVGSVASKNVVGMWTKSAATSGDTRVVYLRHLWNGAAGGEVVRLWATANTTGVAAGGTMNALHATASIAAACTVSGAINAIRATISSANATASGTAAAIQLDSDIVTGATVPAAWAFIRVSDSGLTRLNTLLSTPAASNGTLVAAHTTDAMTHSIKVNFGGTVAYIMCTTTASNRS